MKPKNNLIAFFQCFLWVDYSNNIKSTHEFFINFLNKQNTYTIKIKTNIIILNMLLQFWTGVFIFLKIPRPLIIFKITVLQHFYLLLWCMMLIIQVITMIMKKIQNLIWPFSIMTLAFWKIIMFQWLSECLIKMN